MHWKFTEINAFFLQKMCLEIYICIWYSYTQEEVRARTSHLLYIVNVYISESALEKLNGYLSVST